jgi:hypothetical protein
MKFFCNVIFYGFFSPVGSMAFDAIAMFFSLVFLIMKTTFFFHAKLNLYIYFSIIDSIL